MLELLQDLIGASERQARALQSLKGQIEVETQEMRVTIAEQANQLGEARRELAELDAALEKETHRREAAERSVAAFGSAVADARAALSSVPAAEFFAGEMSSPAPLVAPLGSDPSDASDAATSLMSAEMPATDEQTSEAPPLCIAIVGSDGVTRNASSIRIDLHDDDVELLDWLVAQQGSSRDEIIARLIRSAASPRAGAGASQPRQAAGSG